LGNIILTEFWALTQLGLSTPLKQSNIKNQAIGFSKVCSNNNKNI